MADVGHRSDDVVAYRDRELSPEASAAFEAHLASCAECQADLRAAEAALSTFDDLIGRGPPPLDLDEAMARFRRGEALARAARRKRRRVWAGAGLAIAAAALVALAVTLGQAPKPAARDELAKPQPAAPPRQRPSAPLVPQKKLSAPSRPTERDVGPAAVPR